MEHRKTYRERDGIRRTLCWDDADPGVFHIKTEQDVEPILESVARDREIMKQDGVFHLDYRVPAIVWEQAMREEWEEKDWQRWRDTDGVHFRIWRPRFVRVG
jgi:hypothetical protein